VSHERSTGAVQVDLNVQIATGTRPTTGDAEMRASMPPARRCGAVRCDRRRQRRHGNRAVEPALTTAVAKALKADLILSVAGVDPSLGGLSLRQRSAAKPESRARGTGPSPRQPWSAGANRQGLSHCQALTNHCDQPRNPKRAPEKCGLERYRAQRHLGALRETERWKGRPRAQAEATAIGWSPGSPHREALRY
jgi:hypothetical protein